MASGFGDAFGLASGFGDAFGLASGYGEANGPYQLYQEAVLNVGGSLFWSEHTSFTISIIDLYLIHWFISESSTLFANILAVSLYGITLNDVCYVSTCSASPYSCG